MSYAAQMIAAAQARGDDSEVRFWQSVKRDVDQAPPLTPALRDQLAVLLRAPAAPRPTKSARPFSEAA